MITTLDVHALMRLASKIVAAGQFEKIDRMFEILDITQADDLDIAIVLLRVTHHDYIKSNLKNRQDFLEATAEQLDSSGESSGQELIGLL